MRFVWLSNDPADIVIKGGPFDWDGVTTLEPPPGQHAGLESVALENGYTYPPTESSVLAARTLRQRASSALAANAEFLALGSPTNAQVLGQVRLLTRECNALTRLAANLLDTTEGT